MKQLCCGVALLLCAACGPGATADAPAPAEQGPGAVLAALEERLLAAESVRLAFTVTAEGAVDADIQGEMVVAGDEAGLFANGVLDGQPVNLLLRAGGGQAEYGNMPASASGPAPPFLGEAMLVGLTRMGVLHNLARLSTGLLPDHAEGGVRDWATLGAVVAGDTPGTVAFTTIVDGALAGAATLQLDGDGLLVTREQTVPFADGEVRVVETYSQMSIAPREPSGG